MTMVVAAIALDRIAGLVLNDIGPVVGPRLERIRSSRPGTQFSAWMHAARALAEGSRRTHPAYALEDWLAMAKRTMVLVSNGRIAFDYDMKIAEPILAADQAAVPPDLWPMLRALAGRPAVLVRGERSAILSPATFVEMAAALPSARVVTVPATGHAPTLDEPEVRAAIDAMLAEVA